MLVLHSSKNVKAKLEDNRVVVTIHAHECRQCIWRSGWAETDQELNEQADEQTAHSRETGHKEFWHYTVQRGQSRLYFLPTMDEAKAEA